MVNRVELIGNLTHDPELRYSPSGTAYCYVRLATNRFANGKEYAAYHFVVAWRTLAEQCGERLRKGSRVYVEGRLENSQFTNSDGKRIDRLRIVAGRVLFLDGRADAERRPTPTRERESGAEATHIANVIAGGRADSTEERAVVEEPE
jgi:single-strand DNA-binding protein